MDPADLRKLQLLEFKILLEFKRICEKHNLRYFLIGGTLLGAVRHKGFIPWDDDIDVGMPREDYEIFKVIAKEELGEEYFFQTYETDSGYANLFGKIRLNGTEYLEKANQHCLKHKGIWIDVMPLDKVPESKIFQNGMVFLHTLLQYLILLKYDYVIDWPVSIPKKLCFIILKIVSLITPKKYLLHLRERVCDYSNKSESKSMLGNSDVRKNMPITIFEKTTKLDFEGAMFSVPGDYTSYLHILYGNYMDLPPKEERVPHSLVLPNFGKY